MHIHILGICGTFMGGLALIARELGHEVSGSDQNVYPPMSTQLEQQGIQLLPGYKAENLYPKPDLVVIGNALSRGNPEVEAVLNQGLRYVSGPQWLAEYVLQGRWVLGVAGTHGKTTTTSMLSWILDSVGMQPGFLIGGIPLNFGVSAQLGGGEFFVIEADEYDTAFFDKRSKFVHYRPRTAILNNLEFDHADIFDDLAAIKRQFHHLVRTVPGEGKIIAPACDANIADVLNTGCWTPVDYTAIDDSSKTWSAQLAQADGSEFEVFRQQEPQGRIHWPLTGRHNVYNALAAIAAAHHAGVATAKAAAALSQFENVKRRMEVIVRTDKATVYDDFAHHPTAIQTTLEGLRKRVGSERIIAVVEPRSNTMRLGMHRETLAHSLADADIAILYQPPELSWDLDAVVRYGQNIAVYRSLDEIVVKLKNEAQRGGHFVLMSNGSFGGIYRRLQEELQT
ncbi:MAG: UDP-N-acetylmuramate:L-alanyl-gamma-D-glutamyl-meso-diaminopimelate ligase [Gammaproteobacteria bacterium]